MNKVNIGIVGCGNISEIYLKNLGTAFPGVSVSACADLDMDRARSTAERHGIRALTVPELLADREVDIVLNITIPAAHYAVCEQALLAGKHVYVEKPLSIGLEEATRLVTLAEKRNLRLGCAPDTFLGGGLQTCRELIDGGAIGKPLAATAFLAWHGPEGEHPNPAFLYQHGAGPVFDYGPYYLTALISLLGPLSTISSITGKGFVRRTVTCPGPMEGSSFPVETPTHVTGSLLFQSGAIASLITSFDVWGHSLPFLEIYGTEGTLRAADPDTFGGPVGLLKAGEQTFSPVPVTRGYTANSRGIGLADMAAALEENRPHRAGAQMGLHVVEAMNALLQSWEERRFVELTTTCSRPEPLPAP